ncbi:hypothetical protein ACFWV1_10375 [Streptomyces sp. NPDC058700]|uniref:hypothetical protein n=1 Tax=Streptomyces sp. NPDC058700 TaxID=3346607 RepID=UPI00364DF42F
MGRDAKVARAQSDDNAVLFLENAGIVDPETVIVDPVRTEWQGGRVPRDPRPEQTEGPFPATYMANAVLMLGVLALLFRAGRRLRGAAPTQSGPELRVATEVRGA